MKKKNGFTLVEIVAAIAIMAIIGLIAGVFILCIKTPVINYYSISEEAKEIAQQYFFNFLASVNNALIEA